MTLMRKGEKYFFARFKPSESRRLIALIKILCMENIHAVYQSVSILLVDSEDDFLKNSKHYMLLLGDNFLEIVAWSADIS